jgi:hypothetical protein
MLWECALKKSSRPAIDNGRDGKTAQRCNAPYKVSNHWLGRSRKFPNTVR